MNTIEEIDAEIQRITAIMETYRIREHHLRLQRAQLSRGISTGDYVVVEEKRVNPDTLTRTYARMEGVVVAEMMTGMPVIRLFNKGGVTLSQRRWPIIQGARITNKGPWKGAINE